jgi:hypothetical protein
MIFGQKKQMLEKRVFLSIAFFTFFIFTVPWESHFQKLLVWSNISVKPKDLESLIPKEL